MSEPMGAPKPGTTGEVDSAGCGADFFIVEPAMPPEVMSPSTPETATHATPTSADQPGDTYPANLFRKHSWAGPWEDAQNS